jgi:hypothetical protein
LNAAAIDFELRFTGTARSDAAAESRKICADADQVRLTVAQLREFDLQLTFAAARMPREDIENQHRAIDDRHADDFFEILSLARAQIVEHKHETCVALPHEIRNFMRLSRTDERRRIDVRALLHDPVDEFGACSFGKRFELDQFRFERAFWVFGVDSDDNRSISQRSPSL